MRDLVKIPPFDMYQIKFTDGTFITAFKDDPAEYLTGDSLEHTISLPNFVCRKIDPAFTVTKHDMDGNKWVFTHELDGNLNVRITNGDGLDTFINPSARDSYFFSYNETTNKVSIISSNGQPLAGQPYASQDSRFYLYLNMYNNDGNSTYPTVGDAIVSGKTRTRGYRISNVLNMSASAFLHSMASFYKLDVTQRMSDIWNSSSRSTATSATLNLSSLTVEDYDPAITPESDPYEPGGTNDDDPDKVGGEGDFTDQDEPTPLPNLPALSAIDTGLVTVYNPSNADLKNLANYLWSDLFSLDTFKKLFADPMDAILGLSVVPVQPPVSGSAQVTVGNIGTGISMPKVSNQYVRVDCGSLNVKEYWGAYLDYAPYTKAEIYLPYIGIRALNIDDVMAKTIHVYYHVDVLSGGCTCFVYSGDKIAYTFAGSCASSIPISGTDWTNVINGVLSAAGAIGATVATGGMAAPMALGTIASTAVNASKPNVEKSGGMSGAAGLLSYQKPFIILTRPRQAMSRQQYEYMGYPSWASRDISELSGYIEVEYVHLDSINATQEELDEIHQLLTTGVIV